MPISTPNRVADPVLLERYDPPAVIIFSGELSVAYYNSLATSILQGEPVIIGGRVGLAQSVILPGTVGTVVMDWVADLRVDAALAANILQNDTVWWSYDITTVAAGVGGAVRAAPTNGFIIGLAITQTDPIRLNGSSKAIAAAPGDRWVRVISNYEPAVAIGTIPVFN
jgi:hypothetical protein